MDVVNQAVRDLSLDAETKSLTGYRADFALFKTLGDSESGEEVFETGLVEVNDGYVAGRYDDMTVKDFADMIISRFGSL